MLYFPQHKVAFLHGQRTGGTSILRWAEINYPYLTQRIQLIDWHSPLRNKIEAGFSMEGNTVFTSIRNPYEAIYGMYQLFRHMKPDAGHITMARSCEFKEFAKWFCQINSQLTDVNMLVAYPRFIGIDGKIPTNLLIMHIETLQEDFNTVARLTGLDSFNTQLPHVNRITDKEVNGGPLQEKITEYHYSPDVYDYETAGYVMSVFEWAFESGHYDIDWRIIKPLRGV